MDIPTQAIKIETIETLLLHRLPEAEEDHCAETEVVAMAIAGLGDDTVVKSASDHLERCSRCREAALMLHRIDAPTVLPQLNDRTPESVVLGKQPLWRRIPLSAAAALALIVSAAAIALWNPNRLTTDPHRETSSEAQPSVALSEHRFKVKGFEDTFLVAVRRGERVNVATQEINHLKTGDQLGMFYSALNPGYLMVVNIDQAGRTSILYPAGQRRSAAIAAGENRSLADGAVVNEGTGCEWITAIFSDAPLEIATVKAAIETSQKRDNNCTLDVSIPKARTVKIVPFSR